MIDRQTVYQIADYAIRKYAASCIVDASEARLRAAWATADHWAEQMPDDDDIEAEVDRINEEYLAQTARQAVVHWLRYGWARERIARRKEMEAMSR